MKSEDVLALKGIQRQHKAIEDETPRFGCNCCRKHDKYSFLKEERRFRFDRSVQYQFRKLAINDIVMGCR